MITQQVGHSAYFVSLSRKEIKQYDIMKLSNLLDNFMILSF